MTVDRSICDSAPCSVWHIRHSIRHRRIIYRTRTSARSIPSQTENSGLGWNEQFPGGTL